MERAFAVVGANWGDEGKGLAVDALCNLLNHNDHFPVVWRHNSGPQAGHTVERSGRRHVFHHVGSGALVGSPTVLGDQFVSNPFVFLREMDSLLLEFGVVPTVHVSIDSRITTVWDVILNQTRENARGDSRHGSCGMGFGDTIARAEILGDYSTLTYRHSFMTRNALRLRLRRIQDWCVGQVVTGIGREYVPGHLLQIFESEESIDVMVDQIFEFRDRTNVLSASTVEPHETVIFEGAQGLGLSMDSKDFPHVTRAYTGLKDVWTSMEEYLPEVKKLDAFYMTRSYFTRHGRGPFPNEDESAKPKLFSDQTNVWNEHQEGFRFAPFDMDSIRERVANDFCESLLHKTIESRAFLGVTCLDQHGEDHIPVIVGGQKHMMTQEAFLGVLETEVEKVGMVSTGPASSDVHFKTEIA